MKREWEIMNMKKGQGIKKGTHKVSPHPTSHTHFNPSYILGLYPNLHHMS
jgi:hypothetical protein